MTDDPDTPEDFDDIVDEDEHFDESLSTSHEDRTGAAIGNAIAGACSSFLFNIALLVSRLMPFSAKFWNGMITAGYQGLLKKSGGDALGHIVEQGRLRHVPVAYVSDAEEGPGADPRWKTQDGDWWKASAEAEQTYLCGKVPTVWASSAANELGTNVQAEVAEVIDAGGGKPVFESATVNHTMLQVDGEAQDGAALADGGQQVSQEFVNVENPGGLKDYLVPLGHDADGRVVSMEKYYELYPSTPGPEEMHTQNLLGRLAEADPSDKMAYAMKMLLIAGAIVVGALAMVFVAPQLLGGSGGGGGGGGGMLPTISLASSFMSPLTGLF